MPRGKGFSYPADWLKKALGDFARVRVRLREGDVEDAAFHLQQAVEKALKAYLLLKGWRLKKIHDLEALLDDAVKYHAPFEPFRPLVQEVTGYYLTERYPGFEEGPSEEEVATTYDQAKPLIKHIQRFLNSKTRSPRSHR